jgi:hypothetical protein
MVPLQARRDVQAASIIECNNICRLFVGVFNAGSAAERWREVLLEHC